MLQAIFFLTMKKLLIILLTITFLIIGLSVIRVTPRWTISGFFAGECIGNCGTMYEVTSGVIRVDTTSFWELKGETEKLKILGQRFLEQDHEGDFDSYKVTIPLVMLFDPRKQFGCPDCIDQGGYFFEFEVFGIRRQFKIDKGHEPIYHFNLTQDIQDKIEMIQGELKKYGR